jgi:hypothetical protein
VAKLGRIPGVARISRQDGEIAVEWSRAKDLREEVSATVVEKGWGLLEMRSVMNLEELYLRIVSGGEVQ